MEFLLPEKRILQSGDPQVAVLISAGWTLIARSWGVGLNGSAVDLECLGRLAVPGQRGLTLRRLTSTDAAAALDLDQETSADYPGDVATAWQPLTPANANPSPERIGWGAFRKDELIGMVYADLDPNDQTRAEIDMIVIAKPWRGRGVGKALLAFATSDLICNGHASIRTGVADENTASIAILEAVGFIRDEEWFTLVAPSADR